MLFTSQCLLHYKIHDALLSGLEKARENGACNLSVVPTALGHYSMYFPVLDDGAFTSVGGKKDRWKKTEHYIHNKQCMQCINQYYT